MENKLKVINWEKIGVYIAAFAVVVTQWSFLQETQEDNAEMRERIAKLEVKMEYLEKK